MAANTAVDEAFRFFNTLLFTGDFVNCGVLEINRPFIACDLHDLFRNPSSIQHITTLETNMEGPKIMAWKMYILLNMAIFGIYVRFLGCIAPSFFFPLKKGSSFRMNHIFSPKKKTSLLMPCQHNYDRFACSVVELYK